MRIVSLLFRYFDLNDPTRSVQHIFDEAMRNGWDGDYTTDQTSANQYYAGFGWGYHGIDDYGGNRIRSVICERIEGTSIELKPIGNCFLKKLSTISLISKQLVTVFRKS